MGANKLRTHKFNVELLCHICLGAGINHTFSGDIVDCARCEGRGFVKKYLTVPQYLEALERIKDAKTV